MNPETLLDATRRVFAADRYATELSGIEITEVGDHTATCRLDLDDRHRNARGSAMGGVLFTLADFAAAVAANTGCIAHGEELQWVSLDATIHYLAPAIGKTLTASCTPVKAGRTTTLLQTTITCDTKQVAVVSTTMIHI